MRLEEEFNQITVQETPGCLWLFGLFFALIGAMLVYGSVGGFVNSGVIPIWQLALTFLMGAAGIAVGIWLIYLAPFNRVIINRQTEIVTHLKIGLFGKQTKNYSFEHLKQFSLIEETDDEGALIWSLGMDLSNGETIKISSLPSHSEKFKRDFVFQINDFMDKPVLSYKSFGELEDESETKMS